jgi:protein-disulfide isomerase
VLDSVLKEYGDRIRLVVRDFPLARHANAFRAAVAAEAAREQGKYWEFADLVFRNQSSLSEEGLAALAAQAGLDAEQYSRAVQSPELSAKVERDRQEAIRLGVNSTPTLFVNGRRVSDRSYEGLRSVVEAALNHEATRSHTKKE